jgi:hypothetical protein
MQKESRWDPRIDLRPNGIESVLHRKHNGFEIFNASDITLDNCSVIWSKESRDQYGDAVVESNSVNVRKLNFVEVVNGD